MKIFSSQNSMCPLPFFWEKFNAILIPNPLYLDSRIFFCLLIKFCVLKFADVGRGEGQLNRLIFGQRKELVWILVGYHLALQWDKTQRKERPFGFISVFYNKSHHLVIILKSTLFVERGGISNFRVMNPVIETKLHLLLEENKNVNSSYLWIVRLLFYKSFNLVLGALFASFP